MLKRAGILEQSSGLCVVRTEALRERLFDAYSDVVNYFGVEAEGGEPTGS